MDWCQSAQMMGFEASVLLFLPHHQQQSLLQPFSIWYSSKTRQKLKEDQKVRPKEGKRSQHERAVSDTAQVKTTKSKACWRKGRRRDGRSDNGLLLLSHLSRVQLCATPQTAAHQAPRSLGFSRQKYWSGVPLPSPFKEQVSFNFNQIKSLS